MPKRLSRTLTERLEGIGRDGSNRPVSRAHRAEEVGLAILQDQYPDVEWALKADDRVHGPDVIGTDGGQSYTAEVKLARTRSSNPTAALSNTVHGRQGSVEYTNQWLRRGRRK